VTDGKRTDWFQIEDSPRGHHDRLLGLLGAETLASTTIGELSLLTVHKRRDVTNVLTDTHHFSADVVALTYFPVFGLQPLMSDDGPWRRTVRAELTRCIKAHYPDRRALTAIVGRVLDDLDADSCQDLFSTVASRISAWVFATLIGVSPDVGDSIASSAADVARFGIAPLNALRAARRLRSTLLTALDSQASSSDTGLLAALARYVAQGTISHDRLLDSLLMLALASTETTTAAISAMLYGLLDAKGRGGLDDRSLKGSLGAEAAAEVLRWEPPVQMTCRRVTEDATVNNTRLRSGSLVLVHLGAASLDDSSGWVRQPAQFTLDRPWRPPTLAFGTGHHRCPGARLAWSELDITAAQFMHRFPNAALSEPDAAGVSGSMLRIAAPLRVMPGPR